MADILLAGNLPKPVAVKIIFILYILYVFSKMGSKREANMISFYLGIF